MKSFTTFTALTAALAVAGSASASGIILSDSDSSSTDTVDQVLNIGDSSSIYVWVTPDAGQKIIGFALDITSSDASVLEADAFTFFNPTYLSGNLGSTWDGTSSGTLGDLVDDANAVAVTENGINQALEDFFDGTTDEGAFLVGVLDFTATGEGVTTVNPAEGVDILVDTNGQFFPNFVGGTVTVIPEPSSIALLGLGSLLIARRRRG